MITAEDFILELNDTEDSKNFKLATVTSLFANKTAKVQFDGEDTPSEKQYAYLASYTPKTLDRVMLAVVGGTYVILGKVNYNVSPPTEEELDRYLFDQKLVTMTKGLTISGLASLNGGVSVVGDIGLNGTVTATGLSTSGTITASGNISGKDITSTGTIKGTEGHISGGFTCYDFHHRGSYLSFFNKFQNVPKQNISPLTGTPTVQGNFNAINVIVNALRNYGLF